CRNRGGEALGGGGGQVEDDPRDLGHPRDGLGTDGSRAQGDRGGRPASSPGDRLNRGRPAMGGKPQPGRRRSRWERLMDWAVRPLRRLWLSHQPLDAYLLVQMTSGAGDALVAIALADSVFFSVPVGQAKLKV